MEVSRRKSLPRNVVAGSVWESRMKMDEVKGGIRVFNGVEDHLEEELHSSKVDERNEILPTTEPQNPQNQSTTTTTRERRKTWKAEPIEVIGNQIGSHSIQSRKIRLEPNKNSSKSCKDFGLCLDELEKNSVNSVQVKHTRSVSHKDLNDSCKELSVTNSKEKIISNDSCKELRTPLMESSDHEEEEVIEKKFDVKEIDVSEQKLPKKIVKEEKKVNQIYRKSPIPLSSNLKKQSVLVKDHSVNNQELKKSAPIPLAEEFERIPRNQSKLQNIVDLVMWRDVAKSAFVFGLGTFIIISSAYTDDLDISMVSVFSYMGLVYLAAIFIHKSIICRGNANVESSIHLVGEEEAIWFLRLVLPCLNETLLELKAIFSGDPATTMKLALLLFISARWGSYITIGKMLKLGFFGAFTIPKVCSSYSSHLFSYGGLWIQQLRDTWHSCARKKVIAFVAFLLLWKFSSTLTRIWAVFMLVVTVRYYQQSERSTQGKEQGEVECDTDAKTVKGGRRQPQGVWADRVNTVKVNKEP
ncbi:hypothetical protein ACHQM5_029893 [Ranunculus cassubicifolius]